MPKRNSSASFVSLARMALDRGLVPDASGDCLMETREETRRNATEKSAVCLGPNQTLGESE